MVPRNYANLVGAVVVAAIISLLVWLRPSPRQCTVTESYESDGPCILVGEVSGQDKAQKAINARTLDGKPLDVVTLSDATGDRDVWFDPQKIDLTSGTRVRVQGRNVKEEATGASRFVANSVEPDR
jgi:hypothetical protein